MPHEVGCLMAADIGHRRRGRPPAGQTGRSSLPPGHRCTDPEWWRAHDMGGLRRPGRNSVLSRRHNRGCEYASPDAKVCPCRGGGC